MEKIFHLREALGFCLFLASSTVALSLDPTRDISQYNSRTWTRQSGLPVNGINDIAQTSDGHIWLGTAAGLVRFDGQEFQLVDFAQVSDLKTTVVRCLSVRGNDLWVGLENSAFGFYDGKTFSLRGKPEWGGLDMNVRKIIQGDAGELWLLSMFQAATLSGDGKYTETLSGVKSNVLGGYKDAHGDVWVGTAGNGVYSTRGGHFAKFAPMGEETVMGIAVDKEDNLWFGTSTGIRGFDRELKPIEIPPFSEAVRVLLADSHGVLWIGTDTLGLIRYRNGQYKPLDTTREAVHDRVNAIWEDREGSIWMGTSGGLTQLTDVKFAAIPPTTDGTNASAAGVFASKNGGIWVGANSALSYFGGRAEGKNKTYSLESGLPNGYVKRIYEARNGDVYFVSGASTLSVLSGPKITATYTAPNLIVGIAEDAHGVIVSVGGELRRVENENLVPYHFNQEAPDFHWILALLPESDGSIWVACETGLYRIKNGDVLQSIGTNDGPVTLGAQSIYKETDGTLWVGLLSGIARIKNNQVCCIDRKSGLYDNNIYGVIPDDLGTIWMDSSRGIFCITKQNIQDFADQKIPRVSCVPYDDIESINAADKTDVQERLGCKSLDGRIWFPGPKGVVMIDPSHILTNPIAPPVYVDVVIANRVKLSSGEHIVPPGEGELEFHFSALTFIAPQKTRFRYQLKGYDDSWVEAGSRKIAFYTNLKPGIYTFRVVAANADGVWNNTGDSWLIELRPHFYQTNWFYTLCALTFLTALGGIYLLRVRQLEAKRKFFQEARDRLEAEVRLRTGELATVNSSLQREVEQHKSTGLELLERSKALEREIEERKRMQQEIERVHRMLLDNSRQAGMAEIATNVLHNVGNVLNSVNVSCAIVHENIKKSSARNLAKTVALLREHESDLGTFIETDPRGKLIPTYLSQLSDRLASEKEKSMIELELLRNNIEHIKEIVSMQQNYATVSGIQEVINIRDLAEDSLRMNVGAMDRHGVRVIREYDDVPPLCVDRHRILQILVNFIRNAKYACDDSGRADKQLTLRITNDVENVRISIIDNGVGIPPENLNRIFNHGFTTRKEGHGFGLHSGALAAKEMGGSVSVHSDGLGHGATFTLSLPVHAQRVMKAESNL